MCSDVNCDLFLSMKKQFQIYNFILNMQSLLIFINVGNSLSSYKLNIIFVMAAGKLPTISKLNDATVCKRSHRCKVLLISHGV